MRAPAGAWRALPLLLLLWGGAARVAAATATAAAVPGAGMPLAEISVALPAGPVTVGDRAEALITVRAPAASLAAAPRFPSWRGAWGEAEVREQGEPRRIGSSSGGIAVFRQRLVLAAFRPGKVALPRVSIAVPLRSGTVQAWTPAGLALAVRSVLPAGGKDLRPRPPAPLRQLPWGAAFFWVLAILTAMAAAGAWALWRRGRQRRGALAAPAPRLAPLPELLAALDRLAVETAPLPLHTGISHALRRYLGRAAGFPAPESTTTEIQRLLLARGWPAGLVRPAVDLLRACDLVKFARQEVGESRSRERLAAARQLGEQIEAHARLAAGAEEARAGLEAAG